MYQIKTNVLKFSREESGQDLIEYALIAGLLGLAAVSSLRNLAAYINQEFGRLSTQLYNAN